MPKETARPLNPLQASPVQDTFTPPQHESPHELDGFLQKRWVQNVMPWVASLAMHTGIVAIAAAMVVVVTVPPQFLRQEQTVIPSPVMAQQNANVVPTFNASVDVQTLTDQNPDSSAATPTVDASGGGNNALDLATAGAESSGPGGPRVFSGLGPPGGGKGDGNGRGVSLGGPPGSGFSGPNGPIFRSCGGGNARNIVFVCDASGSMTNKFATLKEQLNRAISKLRAPQSFDILFFQDGKAICFSRDHLHQDSLALATPDRKRDAGAFLENVTIGASSDPSEALRLAFQRKPDLLYLLTDGDFPDNQAVRAKVTALNQPRADGHKVKVNTIAFLNDNETNDSIRSTLEKIAADQQGIFVQITESQIEDEEVGQRR